MDSLSPSLSLYRRVNVSLPEETRANGTLYAVVYVHKAGVSPLEDSREVHYAAQLTTYITPTHSEGQREAHKVKRDSLCLPQSHTLSFQPRLNRTHTRRASELFLWLHQRPSPKPQSPVSHWRPHLSISLMSEDFTFNKAGLPSDVRRYMRV